MAIRSYAVMLSEYELQAVIDHHDQNIVEAEAYDMADCIPYHEERKKELASLLKETECPTQQQPKL